jgi:hypothetical protein
MCNLFADMKAISIPEKKAEVIIEKRMMMISISIYGLVLFSIFFLKFLLKKNINKIKIEKPSIYNALF